MSSFDFDEGILAFATPRQSELILAWREHGGTRKASEALNVHRSAFQQALKAVTKRAAQQGYSPKHDMIHTVPDGYTVKGVSTYYNKDGKPTGQWVKSSADEQRRYEIMREAITGLAEDVRGLAPITAPPAASESDLLAVYPMGDPHFGLYSYAEETGDNFDLQIAEQVTCNAIDRLVASTPAASTGLLLNLGDAFHADDSSNQTPNSGHALDVDTRFAKVAKIALKAMTHCVRRLLEKHERVLVWNMAGNHDPHSAMWLAIAMDAFFSNNPRVEVDLSPSLYKFYRFGRVLIGAHHGHGAKSNDLPLLMAADRPEDWGSTEFRHWMCGHIHHWTAKEHPGVVVETFRTLAGKDAWHAGKGYRSRRDMNCIVFHAKYGEIQRIKCDITRLADG